MYIELISSFHGLLHSVRGHRSQVEKIEIEKVNLIKIHESHETTCEKSDRQTTVKKVKELDSEHDGRQ